MKWSQTLIPTMKEIPNGAEIPSHIFMLRAGMISQVMAGAYAYLPLGWRCLHKATKIVRDEMDKAGGVELFMTALCPQSLYEQTNRVEAFGNVLIKSRLLPYARRRDYEPRFPVCVELPSASSAALSDSDEIPERGASEVRRFAHKRIPYEGRVQLPYRS